MPKININTFLKRPEFLLTAEDHNFRFFNEMNKLHTGFQYLILLLIAIVIWRIYYPGIMSPDSLNQYAQAYYGFFEDAHPPLMSLLLRLLIKVGGGISVLILFQCLFALFGLRSLISVCLRFFSDSFISIKSAGLIATLIVLIFLLPFLSPFIFFSLIFWKDAWLTIMLLWITSYLLWIFLNLDSFGKRNFLIHILSLSIISSLMVTVRHNALVITPVICFVVAVFVKTKFKGKWITTIALAVLPLLLTLAVNPIFVGVFNIRQLHFGNNLFASDLKILLKIYPELQGEFPLTARHQNSPIILGTKQGGIWDESTEGVDCPIIDCNNMPMACYGTESNTRNINGSNCYMPVGRDNKTLRNEYFRAIFSHPVKLAYVKIYLYWQILHPRNWWDQKVSYDIYENTFDLKFNEGFSGARTTLNDLSKVTGNKWYFVWVSGIHILWLVLNVLAVIYSLVKVFTKRNLKSVVNLMLFLIPLSYYFSYLLAAVAPDYRYMFPSTLLMQIFVVTILLSKVFTFSRRQIND